MNDIAALLDRLDSSDPEKFTAFDRLRVHAGTDGYDFFDTEHAQEVLDWCDEAATYLRSSPSQVAPQPQAGEPVVWQRRVKFVEARNYQPGDWEQCSKQEATGHFERQPGFEYRPLYASPQPANPAQVTDAIRDCITLVENTIEDGSEHEHGDRELVRKAFAELAAIGAGGQAVAEDAREALRELANVKMDISLEDWCRISNTILSALSQPHPADERVVEALELAEEAEKTAVFWGAEANKAMLQGDHDEAKRCLARAKRHSILAVRLRATEGR